MLAGRQARRGLCLAALAALAGCTTLNMDPMLRADDGPASREAYARRLVQLQGLGKWNVRGRMALRTSEEDVNANVRWRQAGDRYTVDLSNPLGQTLLQLRGAPGRVSLRTAKGEERSAPTAESLLSDTTGWTMPVSALRHWLLGRPDPSIAVDAISSDADGRPLTIEQSGWQVEYKAYTSVDGLELPARVELVRDDVSAKLILRGWQA